MTTQENELAGNGGDRPGPSETAKEKARKMMRAYDGDRPTVVLPGSHGTVSGTAINDWLDEDGNPKFGKANAE
jgi:hypothetical protein